MEDKIYTHLKVVVTFHDVLNVLHVIIRTGTSIMELKMAQELVIIDQDPLFMMLLYMLKSHDTLYHSIILQTLEGYVKWLPGITVTTGHILGPPTGRHRGG